MEFWGGLAFTYLPLKRFYKYVLKRLIGSFLRHDIDLEHLDVQLYRGIVQLKSLELDVTQFNMAAVGAGLLVHFVSGFVGAIKMDIPWRHLLGEACKIHVDGLHLVLAKGAPQDMLDWSTFSSDKAGNSSENTAENSEAQVVGEALGSSRYSNEGVETLSRLVKHVLSKTEACFRDTSVSLNQNVSAFDSGLATEGGSTQSALTARLSTVRLSPDHTTVESDARHVEVGSINVSVVESNASSHGASGSGLASEQCQQEVVIVSTDVPFASEEKSGDLYIRRRRVDVIDAGIFLDFEVLFPALRMAFSPLALKAMSSFLSMLDEHGVAVRSSAAVDCIDGVTTDASGAPAASMRMVQSFVESSIAGNTGQTGFWHELYDLFEADTHLEEATRSPDEAGAEVWNEPPLDPEGVDSNELDSVNGATLGHVSDLPGIDEDTLGLILGCTLKVKVLKVDIVFAFVENDSQLFDSTAMTLEPAPVKASSAEQLQIFIEQWEVSMKQTLDPLLDTTGRNSFMSAEPAVTFLCYTVGAYLHLPINDADSACASGVERIPASSLPKESTSSPGPRQFPIELDAAMFSSARSTLLGPSLVSSAGNATPPLARQLSEGSTDESIGGSEESFMASSLHSFDSPMAGSLNPATQMQYVLPFDEAEKVDKDTPHHATSCPILSATCASDGYHIANGFHSKQLFCLEERCEQTGVDDPRRSDNAPIAGYRFRLDFGQDVIDDETCKTKPVKKSRLRIDCSPLVFRFCARSMHTIARGAARLQNSLMVDRAPHLETVTSIPPCNSQELPVLAVSAVATRLRLELDLGVARDMHCTIVVDIVAPSLVAQAPFSAPLDKVGDASPGRFEEIAYAEVADAVGYFFYRGDDMKGSPSDVPSESQVCLRILSADQGHSAKASLGVFKYSCLERCTHEPHEEVALARTPDVPPADTVISATSSEWTKISLLPIESERRSSKSSLMLQDLRDASQQLWRPRCNSSFADVPVAMVIPHTGGATASHHAGQLSAPDPAENLDDQAADVSSCIQDGQIEIQLNVAGAVRMKMDHERFSLLQEACSAFAACYTKIAVDTPECSQSLPRSVNNAGEDHEKHVLLGGSVALGSVCFDILREQAETDLDEQFRFCVSPVQCRFVQYRDCSFDFHLLGQDVRLEGVETLGSRPEQFVTPWFDPFSKTSREAQELSTPLDALTRIKLKFLSDQSWCPWEAFPMRACTADEVISPVFASIESGRWLETHGVLLNLVRQRLGPNSETCISLKLNRIGVVAHPSTYDAYRQLVAFLRVSDPNPQTPLASSSSVPAPIGTTICKLSIINCLIDLPSEAHFQVKSSVECSNACEGDQWRAVVYVDSCDLSSSTSHEDVAETAKVSIGECNVFFVDHARHLPQMDSSISSSELQDVLLQRGFARILELSDASAVFTSQGSQTLTQGFGNGGLCQSLDISVASLCGHVCSDTVRSLLCMGMELSEDMTLQELFCDRACESPSGLSDQQAKAGSVLDPLRAPMQAETPRTVASDVNILHDIDMSAFEWSALDKGAPSFGETDPLPSKSHRIEKPTAAVSSCASATALEGCLIEDYIRTQQEQQIVHSPIQTQIDDAPLLGNIGPLELDPFFDNATDHPLEVTGADSLDQSQSHPSVIVGLFDISAFSTDELRELSLQDEAARRDVARAFLKDDRGSASLPVTITTAPAMTDASSQRLQDGSVATWLIDPTEVNVLQDHFDITGEAQPANTIAMHPSAHARPMQFSLNFRCKEASLSLYGGRDFADDVHCKPHVPGATPDVNLRKRTTYLMLYLQNSGVELVTFDTMHAVHAGNYNKDCGVRRQLKMRIMNFSIVDHIQGSVFSHLLSCKESDNQRPRQTHVEMLNLQVEEVLPQLPWVADTSSANVFEYRVDLCLLPLHLTVDQDTVDFLINFVQLCFLPTYVEEQSQDVLRDDDSDGAATSDCALQRAHTPAGRDVGRPAQKKQGPLPGKQPATVFQRFSVSAFLMSVDYRAKRLDVNALKRGELWELVNLLPLLEGLEVAFRKVSIGRVKGADVLSQLVNAWSADLNRTQILRSLTGVTPIRSFVNIGGGFVEMVLEPLRLYRAGNDSQQVSGALLRGLVSFLKHVTVESIDITERIFVGTQSALEYVNTCLQEPRENSASSSATLSARLHDYSSMGDGQQLVLSEQWTPVERGAGDFLQPGTVGEGLQHACTNLARGMRHAGKAVVSKPLLEMQRGASKGKVLQSIVSGIPVCILRPAIGATAAAAMALRGLRNSVDPAKRREGERKYKEPE